MPDPVDALILDLLEWLGPGPRPYRDVVDAWRTSCPRLPVWEEANERGFIDHGRDAGAQAVVSVSASGARFLAERRRIDSIARGQKGCGSLVALAGVLIVVTIGTSARAAQTPAFDVLEGGGSPFPPQASPTDPQFPTGGLNDGSMREFSKPTVFLDTNGPAGTVDFARLPTVNGLAPARIYSVTLYTLSDGGVEDGPRGVSNFRLFAGLSSASGPELLLLDSVNPRDDGSPNTYTFPEVTVWSVWPFFTRSTDAGPRVVELDGIGVVVPEPGSAAVTALVAGGALLLRRRRQ